MIFNFQAEYMLNKLSLNFNESQPVYVTLCLEKKSKCPLASNIWQEKLALRKINNDVVTPEYIFWIFDVIKFALLPLAFDQILISISYAEKQIYISFNQVLTKNNIFLKKALCQG